MHPFFEDVIEEIEGRIEKNPKECKKLRWLLNSIKRYIRQLPCLGFNSSKYVFILNNFICKNVFHFLISILDNIKHGTYISFKTCYKSFK